MKAGSHCMLESCSETSPRVQTVQVEVSLTHPLLVLKQALPWEAITEVTSSPWLKPGVSHPWGEHQMLCLLRRHLLTSPWLKPGASRRTW